VIRVSRRRHGHGRRRHPCGPAGQRAFVSIIGHLEESLSEGMFHGPRGWIAVKCVVVIVVVVVVVVVGAVDHEVVVPEHLVVVAVVTIVDHVVIVDSIVDANMNSIVDAIINSIADHVVVNAIDGMREIQISILKRIRGQRCESCGIGTVERRWHHRPHCTALWIGERHGHRHRVERRIEIGIGMAIAESHVVGVGATISKSIIHHGHRHDVTVTTWTSPPSDRESRQRILSPNNATRFRTLSKLQRHRLPLPKPEMEIRPHQRPGGNAHEAPSLEPPDETGEFGVAEAGRGEDFGGESLLVRDVEVGAAREPVDEVVGLRVGNYFVEEAGEVDGCGCGCGRGRRGVLFLFVC